MSKVDTSIDSHKLATDSTEPFLSKNGDPVANLENSCND